MSRKFHSRPVAPGASGSIAGRSSAARLLPTPTGREIQDSSGTEPWLQGREPAGQHSLLQVSTHVVLFMFFLFFFLPLAVT